MLSEAGNALLTAEEQHNPAQAVAQLFRTFHSIKGGAQSFGLEGLGNLAHKLEDMLEPIRAGSMSIGRQAVTVMLAAIELMEEEITALVSGTEADNLVARQQALLREITGLTGENPAQASVPGTKTAPAASRQSENFSRLMYLDFTVHPDNPMPQVKQYLIIERLKEMGGVLYSQGQDEPYKLQAVLGTNLSDAVLESKCAIGDVALAGIAEMSPALLGAEPTLCPVEERDAAEAAQLPPEQLRVLILQPKRDACMLVNKLLTQAGYTVEHTTSAKRLQELMARQKYHIAIVDMGIPDAPGAELLAAIKRYDPLTQVIMTAAGCLPLVQVVRCLEYGASDFLLGHLQQPQAVLTAVKTAAVKWGRWWQVMHTLLGGGANYA